MCLKGRRATLEDIAILSYKRGGETYNLKKAEDLSGLLGQVNLGDNASKVVGFSNQNMGDIGKTQ
jgi:hypothetical protein